MQLDPQHLFPATILWHRQLKPYSAEIWAYPVKSRPRINPMPLRNYVSIYLSLNKNVREVYAHHRDIQANLVEKMW